MQKANEHPVITADRWLEIDLYWFDKGNISKSVEVFWDRFAPLFKGVTGHQGVILNVGWLMDYVLEWQRNLNDLLRLPAQMKSEKYTDYTPLTGTTEQRIAGWEKRFANVQEIPVQYEKWTYGDLKILVESLRQGARRSGLPEMKIGSLMVAWYHVYGGEPSRWTVKNPQAFIFDKDLWSFNVEATLNADASPYGAFPNGISKGLPAYEFFAAQWGDLSRAINLDALVLRDSMIGVGVYYKVGPYGQRAHPDPAKVASYSRANANMVKAVKLANPKVWVMGYSNASCAVADWRVNCFDLEAIAKEGYLDAFIDQTWSGAWNEVGQRRPSTCFWNNAPLGWTQQLAYVLLHAAVLADTKVKHYTLTETFDAWEPWDIIHTAPDRLRWGIWAYLHAGVKTPAGLKFPSGSYISWANQGKELLTENDVQFLAKNITEAALDAGQTKEIFGPTLVYNRSAMEWQSKNAPSISIKEWVDEQAGLVMKFSVPILSVTRLEYLPKVKSDLFVFQTPVHLQPAEQTVVLNLIRSGEPVAIWGSPAGGIDPEIAGLAGLTSTDPAFGPLKFLATRITNDPELSRDVPAEFKLYHQWSKNQASSQTQVLYVVDGSPALTLASADGLNILTWDPGEFDFYVGQNSEMHKPIAEKVGSPFAHLLVAQSLTKLLRDQQRLSATNLGVARPVTIHAWQRTDGAYRVLVADTEEGFDHSAETAREVTLTLPVGWPTTFTELRGHGTIAAVDGKLRIQLQKSEDRFYGTAKKL